MNDNLDPNDGLVPSGMTGPDGEPLYYKPETVARILRAASQPGIPLPDEIQGDPDKIVAYFMDRVAEIQNSAVVEPMGDDDPTPAQMAIIAACQTRVGTSIHAGATRDEILAWLRGPSDPAIVTYDDMTPGQRAIVNAGLGPTREVPSEALVDNSTVSTWLHGRRGDGTE